MRNCIRLCRCDRRSFLGCGCLGVRMNDPTLPQSVMDEIDAARTDIDFIHWDEAHYETVTDEWIVPVEAYFTEEETDGDLGWHHGNMSVEISKLHGLDYSVGDWTPGMHPDLHTFER